MIASSVITITNRFSDLDKTHQAGSHAFRKISSDLPLYGSSVRH